MSRRDYGAIYAAKHGVYAIACKSTNANGSWPAREGVGSDKKSSLIKRIRGQARFHRALCRFVKVTRFRRRYR